MSGVDNDAEMAPGHEPEVDELSEVDEFYNLYEFEELSMPEEPGPSPMVVGGSNAPKWTKISKLQVFSDTGQTAIYANGHQQIKLIIVVRVVDDAFKAVDISEDEFKSIHLVHAHSREPLKFDYIRAGDRPTWKYLMEKIGDFAPLPYSGEFNGPKTHGPGYFVKEFYAASTTTTPVNLVPAIVRSDGKVFYADEESPFGRISLKAHPPAVYARDKFILKHYQDVYYRSDELAAVSCYQLSLVVEQHHIKFVHCQLNNLLRARTIPDKYFVNSYLITYLRGQQVDQVYEPGAEKADSVAIERNEDGKITLLMHFLRNQIKNNIMDVEVPSVNLTVQDMYGNTHVLELSIDPTYSTRIVLMT